MVKLQIKKSNICKVKDFIIHREYKNDLVLK